MKQAIVVGSQESRKDTWLKDFLESVKDYKKIPIKVYFSDNFELSVIKMALNDGYDEFLFLPDSTIIKKIELFNIVFDEYKGKSVSICKYPAVGGMYMMKYRKEVLKKMPIPDVTNKKMAVFWEIVFNTFYAGLDGDVKVLFPDVVHSNKFIEKHGRLNMVMGNEYLDRYKGDWGQKPL